MRRRPAWLLMENVPFMLSLDRGRAMTWLTDALAELGWTWAYRTVDTRAFGLPQRRRRVFMLASPIHDPREVLFADETGPPAVMEDGAAFGFYWTEGRRGLGWAVDAIPTLKAGSSVGIPSPPAIWLPSGELVVPDIRDAERLQGFPADWTRRPGSESRDDQAARWRLIGNAVSVPAAEWIARGLSSPKHAAFRQRPLDRSRSWPRAGWGRGGEAFEALVSEWPVRCDCPPIMEFLRFPTRPLSLRAAQGFRSRTRRGTLRFRPGFLEAVDGHVERMRQE